MCKVILDNFEEEKEFILFNYIFSKKGTFTMSEILEEINALYDSKLTKDDIKPEFDFYVKMGLLEQNMSGYIVCR